MRFAKKRDFSEQEIYDALIAVGCDVERGTDCDLYVCQIDPDGSRWNPTLMECKTPGHNAKRRQPIQKRLQEIFQGQYVVVESVEQALKAVGLNQKENT